MAPRKGNSGKLTEKRRGDRVALFGEGSEGEPLPPPSPQAGVQAPRAGPTDAAARRRAERARPRAQGSAHRLGPAGVPAGRQAGSRVRPGRIWALETRAAVPSGSHTSAAQPRASLPRPSACPPHFAKGRPPGIPRSGRQKSYLSWLGREPGRAAACGWARRASSRLCARGAGVGRKPQTPAACRGFPPPFAGDSEDQPSCGGAHAQRPRRESQPCPHFASRLRENGPPQYFRTVTW